jgi:hypothetical protein
MFQRKSKNIPKQNRQILKNKNFPKKYGKNKTTKRPKQYSVFLHTLHKNNTIFFAETTQNLYNTTNQTHKRPRCTHESFLYSCLVSCVCCGC